MHSRTIRIVLATLAVAYAATHFLAHAHAQSSLGIGTNEAVLPSTGLFAHILNWVNTQQQGFYRQLTGAMKSMRDGGGGAWLLAGLSFAYGVFHAAGPGHGKAVISSYMLANEVALRRGIMLSFLSALLQSLTAIVLMAAVYFILRGSSISMTDASWFLEVTSYALVTLFGAWLLWKKAGARIAARLSGSPAQSLSAAVAFQAPQRTTSVLRTGEGVDCGHGRGLRIRGQVRADAGLGVEEVCETCGNSHAPDPTLLGADRFDWRSAWAAVASVGIRPCTGALIVLTFAFLNGLWIAGIASVLAMGLGTAITVAVLATLAVTAKNVAVTLAGDGRIGNRIHAAVEIAGAAFVFLIGLTLFAATV